MRSLLTALRCLTIFPVGTAEAADEQATRRSRLWYPVIGVFIGLILACAGAFAAQLFTDRLVAAAITVALGVSITGGLHLDGLADSFDGLFATGDRQRRLEIMRDPHLGTFGLAAVVLVLLLKVAGVRAYETTLLPGHLLGAAVAGRCCMLGIAGLLPYPRASGSAKTVVDAAGTLDIIWSVGWMLGVSVLLSWPLDVLAMAVASCSTLVWTALCRWRLGGATGDCLGAACELSETAYLVAAALNLNSAPGWFNIWLKSCWE